MKRSLIVQTYRIVVVPAVAVSSRSGTQACGLATSTCPVSVTLPEEIDKNESYEQCRRHDYHDLRSIHETARNFEDANCYSRQRHSRETSPRWQGWAKAASL